MMNEYEGKILLREWVLDKQIRNQVNDDGIMDWLDFYGTDRSWTLANGQVITCKRDDAHAEFQSQLDFPTWINEQKTTFTDHCINFMLYQLQGGSHNLYNDILANQIDLGGQFKARNGKWYPSPIVQIMKHH